MMKMKFAKDDSMFLMSKCHTSGTTGGQGKRFFIARCGGVSSVASDMFHGVPYWKWCL